MTPEALLEVAHWCCCLGSVGQQWPPLDNKHALPCRVAAQRCAPDRAPEAAMRRPPSPGGATAGARAATGAAPPATRHRAPLAAGVAAGALPRSL